MPGSRGRPHAGELCGSPRRAPAEGSGANPSRSSVLSGSGRGRSRPRAAFVDEQYPKPRHHLLGQARYVYWPLTAGAGYHPVGECPFDPLALGHLTSGFGGPLALVVVDPADRHRAPSIGLWLTCAAWLGCPTCDRGGPHSATKPWVRIGSAAVPMSAQSSAGRAARPDGAARSRDAVVRRLQRDGCR